MTHFNTIANIPIQVEIPQQPNGLAIVKTLLRELDGNLQLLLSQGQNSIIDLRALPPLGVDGYQLLRDVLGEGEVNATITSFGRSLIQETAISGIWWVSHYNQDDELLTEFIEVCYFPEVLKTQKDDVAIGVKKLSNLLNGI
jgi:hydrogenase-1 operon protein HyaF